MECGLYEFSLKSLFDDNNCRNIDIASFSNLNDDNSCISFVDRLLKQPSPKQCNTSSSSTKLDSVKLDNNDITSFGLVKKGLRFANINVCHILPKLDEIKILLHERRTVDLLGVCETLLNEQIDDALLNIEGYDFERKDRDGKSGGGLLVYISKFVQYKRRRDFEQGHIETIWLEVVIPNTKSIFLCSAYRPPSAPTSWIEYLSDEITSACSCNNNEIILCGDFNIDYLNDPPRYWTNALEQFEFTQVIDKPTRVTDKSATLIDHIYTNKPENFHEIKVPFIAISDHYPVCVTRKTSCEKSPKRHYSIQYRDFKHFDEQHFLRQLASSDLHQIESVMDPNAALTKFYDIFLKVLNANAKIKTKRVKHHYNSSWINAEINEARIKRDRFHKAKDMINYKVWRNKVTELLRKSKTDYYQSAIKNNQRPGDIWKHMANLAPKSSKSAPNSITYNGETLTDAKNIADKFNEYYVKLCDNLGLIDHDNEKTL
ncbi:hypothetical protein FSP39_024162 [Pinctada imbricata]|uniref:Endonuclease/exonuclease/phosphatase domain-containing protein n=1 Tax=Pinctada imbricata TaxID=66713 RepID=A0AA88YMI7_PINIB|nr:hypothetical protein FSP39_024162 [Pinctada imbricata]